MCRCCHRLRSRTSQRSLKWFKRIRYSWRSIIRLWRMKVSRKVRNRLRLCSISIRISWTGMSMRGILMAFVRCCWVLGSMRCRLHPNLGKTSFMNLSGTICSRFRKIKGLSSYFLYYKPQTRSSDTPLFLWSVSFVVPWEGWSILPTRRIWQWWRRL